MCVEQTLIAAAYVKCISLATFLIYMQIDAWNNFFAFTSTSYGIFFLRSWFNCKQLDSDVSVNAKLNILLDNSLELFPFFILFLTKKIEIIEKTTIKKMPIFLYVLWLIESLSFSATLINLK